MKRKYVYLTVSTLILAVIAVGFMYFTAKIPNKENNGFVRNVIGEIEAPIREFTFGEHVTKISGVTNNSIYFSGNNPSWVLRTNHNFDFVDTSRFAVEPSVALRAPNIFVDSPNLYMYAPSIAYLLKGNVNSDKIDTLKIESQLITRTAQMSSERLGIRAINDMQAEQVFKIIDCTSGKSLREASLIKQQQFGGFDTDGFFKFDALTSKFYFVYMFQNEILCIDTSLNVVFRSHTIDTNFVNKVNIGLVNSEGTTKVMATTPRTAVNRHFEVGEGYLFIVSGLRADNEELSLFNHIYPIDLYNAVDGTYFGTIYIPKKEKQGIKDLKIFKGKLIVLFENGYCAVFELSNYLPHK